MFYNILGKILSSHKCILNPISPLKIYFCVTKDMMSSATLFVYFTYISNYTYPQIFTVDLTGMGSRNLLMLNLGILGEV